MSRLEETMIRHGQDWRQTRLVALLIPTSLALLLVLLSAVAPSPAYALSSGQVAITAITPFAALDSNNCGAAGPRAMHVQVDVENTSGGTLSNLSANISSLSGSGFAFGSGESTYRYVGTLANAAT